MSKGSLFWANASGKLGEVVNYRAGGEQRARTYVKHIKNPKTILQMKNRILMNNVNSAFRSLRGILQESFPTRPANQSAFNAFVKANKNARPYYISKEDLEASACVPYGLTVSRGNLGLQLKPAMMSWVNAADEAAAKKYAWGISNLLDLDGYEFVDTEGGDGSGIKLTPERLYELFSTRCTVQLPSEAQITVISATYAANDQDTGNDLWQLGYKVYHLQANNAYARTYGFFDQSTGDFDLFLHAKDNVPHPYDGSKTLTFDYLQIGTPKVTPDELAQVCVGIILSFKDAAGNQVSNSLMCSVPQRFDGAKVFDPASEYVWGSDYAQAVLESYGYQTSGVLQSTQPNVAPSDPDEDAGGDGEDLEP